MKILGYDYAVLRDQDSDALGAMGDFRAKPQVIRIASNLTQQQAESTLLHEIIEALVYHLELPIPEHRVIMGLEAGLYQTLTANDVDLSPLLK